MKTVAKALGYSGRNTLFKFLRENGILMKDNVPYQRFIESGYFTVKEFTLVKGDERKNIPQTFVSAKGVEFIEKLIEKKTNA